MKIIDSITLMEDVTLVNLYNAPIQIEFTDAVFSSLKEAGVNVDMICQPTSQKSLTTLSFTIADSQLNRTLEVVSKLRGGCPGLSSAVSSGNCKIVVCGEQMRITPGVAAMVFHAALKAGVNLNLITTSETDISMLVSKADANNLMDALALTFDKA